MQTRAHERLPVNQHVGVKFADRSSLYKMYLTDISRGGLFVATEQSFQLRDMIAVTLEVEGSGAIEIEGEVVHIVTVEQAKSWNGQAGVGVQFRNLDGELREQLEEYLDGLRERLDRELQAAPFDTQLIEQVEAGGRKNDLFGALGVNAKADDIEIEVAIEVRQRALSELWAKPGLAEELRNRIAKALATVEKAGAMLADPRRRLQYLARSGELSAAELAEAATDHREVRDEIALQWRRRNPKAANSAERLARLAREAKTSGDLAGAIKSARMALSQDPFLYKLRENLREWEA